MDNKELIQDLAQFRQHVEVKVISLNKEIRESESIVKVVGPTRETQQRIVIYTQ